MDDVLGNLADRLSYLLRTPGSSLVSAAGEPLTAAAPAARRLVEIKGIGRATKDPRRLLERGGSDPSAAWRLPTEDLLAGLHSQSLPVVFRLTPRGGGVAIELGTWSAQPVPDAALSAQIEVLLAVLGGLYARVDYLPVDVAAVPSRRSTHGGVALGTPTSKPPYGAEFLAPVERIVQSVRDSGASVTVLASPVPAAHGATIRSRLLGEIRAVQLAAHAETVAGPLVEQYLEILSDGLKSMSEGAATGMWRTAVYLTGGTRYAQLASTWQSVYASPTALFDPLLVTDWPDAVPLASLWGMPDVRGDAAPGLYRRPFRYQSLLTSRRLAAYVHLPEQEWPGFEVRLLPAFDSVRTLETSNHDAGGAATRSVVVGSVLHRMKRTGQPYTIAVDDLSRHTLVCGVTGAGKTTTILWLLRQVAALGIPYLVVEPVKKEYRVLLTDPVPRPAVLFTAGDQAVLPLTINPFEVPGDTRLATHIDLLRALFTASFGMWAPLPQILERCIHEVYADRGWNVLTGDNDRLDDAAASAALDRIDAWPTLSDLADKVEEVIAGLGYSGEVTSNMRSALSTRIDGLRTGAKGAMLDVATGVSATALFEQSVVLELEALGADEDRAFVMGLLLLRLTEHRRSGESSRAVRHVFVLEEAHRLLSRSGGTATPDQGDPKSKAVDAFVDMLAEIRSYGQAVIVADQVPVRLAPEVLKNTNLKIMQRIVAAQDRAELAATAAMNEDQSQILATLIRPQAVVYSEGDDTPLLVTIGPLGDNPPPRLGATPPSDDQVRTLAGVTHATVPGVEGGRLRGKELGRSPSWRAAMNRFAACASTDVLAANDHGADLRALLGPQLTGEARHDDTCRAAAIAESTRWLSRRRGAQALWSYADERAYRLALSDAMQALCSGGSAGSTVDAVSAFYNIARRIAARRHDPFPSCAQICVTTPEATPVCLFRYAAADLLAGVALPLTDSVRHALATWTEPATGWDAAANTGVALVGRRARMRPRGAAAREAGLCAAQQTLYRRDDLTPDTALTAVESLIDHSTPEATS